MRVVHVGPPVARLGGPAGYLYELRRAGAGKNPSGIDVRFPPPAALAPRVSAGWVRRGREGLGRLKRVVFGPPPYYRPKESALRSERGEIHDMLEETARASLKDAAASLDLALDDATDTLFTHDPFCAEVVLEKRRAHQQVWMMVHCPMPLALYLAWSWGVPERDWRDILQFPDVAMWIGRELDVWRQVDRLLLPCPEAGEELERIDPRFGTASRRVEYLLTGASAPEAAEARSKRNLPHGPVGLFLGNAQPYRGLDRLLEAIRLVPPALPGVVAVAGPSRETIARHPRILSLGRVTDVFGLLREVDFVINVNRFSLFDLSTIEAAEAGKPLLLHRVGGNKTFQALGAGAVMLADLAPRTIAAGLEAMFSMKQDQMKALGERSRQCYLAHLTSDRLWARHVELYQEAASLVGRA